MQRLLNLIVTGLLAIIQRFLRFPSQLLFMGPGSAEQLATHLVRLGHRRVLIVTDSILVELGVAQGIVQAIEAAGGQADIYAGVLPDPTTDIVEAGLQQLQAQGSEAILALGGGSSIDAAKAIAASATNGPVQSLSGLLKVKQPVVPLFAVPTTAGTGSEATFAAVISDSVTHKKEFLVDTALIPSGVALDPELHKGMPGTVTAATGADALTHAIETHISGWADGEVKRASGAAVRMIFENLPRAYADGSDLAARESMALASYYAGKSINDASVGTVHAIAHQLGAHYGVPHGVANALVLPHVLDSYLPGNAALVAELADIIAPQATGGSELERARAFVLAVRQLLASVGIDTRLEALREEDIRQLAAEAQDECKQYPVPRFLPRKELEAILQKLLK